jgi:penicillin-binding protein 1A
MHKLGATSYCTQGQDVTAQLSAAIGGCGIKQTDLVNAFASLARNGVYKPQSSILKVTNSSGEVLKQWADTPGIKVIDPQSAYIVDDILSDDKARTPLDGPHALGMDIPGVKTATKTGTSDKGGNAKDIWMVSYSPALTMAVWLGNHDATILKNGTSSMSGPIIATVMSYAHLTVYASDGKWKSGDWFTQPAGIQKVGTELYPSWWNKTQGQTNATLTFDSISKKKATDCTPPGAKIDIAVTKSVDPLTKKDVYIAPDGYDASKDDDVHKCDDVKPSVAVTFAPAGPADSYTITVTAGSSTFSTKSIDIKINGSTVKTLPGSGTYTYNVPATATAPQTLTATITDTGLYTADGSAVTTIPAHS